MVPVPQDLVQVLKVDQLESLQSMGQAKSLQTVEARRVGHLTPPWLESVVMVRVLNFRGVPWASGELQLAAQAPYPDQALTLQSMGHSNLLHETVLEKVGQAMPPYLALVTTVRVLVLRPVVPQVLVQASYPVQAVTLQSIGQAWRLQVRVWRSVVHLAPPWATLVTTDLVRYMVPVPQDLVQLLKVDQLESLQSMGQANLLQVVVEERVGQSLPPYFWSVETTRVLIFMPLVPQVAEQEAYPVHAVTTQSMGQGCLLQTRSISVGHSSPPWAAATSTSKVRV
jgi:hypothetical protein